MEGFTAAEIVKMVVFFVGFIALVFIATPSTR